MRRRHSTMKTPNERRRVACGDRRRLRGRESCSSCAKQPREAQLQAAARDGCSERYGRP